MTSALAAEHFRCSSFLEAYCLLIEILLLSFDLSVTAQRDILKQRLSSCFRLAAVVVAVVVCGYCDVFSPPVGSVHSLVMLLLQPY